MLGTCTWKWRDARNPQRSNPFSRAVVVFADLYFPVLYSPHSIFATGMPAFLYKELLRMPCKKTRPGPSLFIRRKAKGDVRHKMRMLRVESLGEGVGSCLEQGGCMLKVQYYPNKFRCCRRCARPLRCPASWGSEWLLDCCTRGICRVAAPEAPDPRCWPNHPDDCRNKNQCLSDTRYTYQCVTEYITYEE